MYGNPNSFVDDVNQQLDLGVFQQIKYKISLKHSLLFILVGLILIVIKILKVFKCCCCCCCSKKVVVQEPLPLDDSIKLEMGYNKDNEQKRQEKERKLTKRRTVNANADQEEKMEELTIHLCP